MTALFRAGLGRRWILLCLILLFRTVVTQASTVELKVLNKAPSAVELFWVDPNASNKGKENLVSMGAPIPAGSEVGLNSFPGHRFVVRYSGSDVSVTKSKPQPVDARFTKGPTNEQFIVEYDANTNLLRASTSARKFHDVADAVNYATTSCQDLRGDAFSSCVAGNIIDDVSRLADGKSQMGKFFDSMSSRLRNYTCADDNMTTTAPLQQYNISLESILKDGFYDEMINGDGRNNSYTVNVLLDKDNAKIWTVDNFVTPEECEVLIKYGRPRLTRATVAAEDGTSIVSEARKANQAGYNMHSKRPEEDPLWPLFNRILGLTNNHAGYHLEPPGQEDFTIIQYNPDDQYTPHCDGACNNEMHVDTGRVATAVMYCKTADRGGATTFTKSDIFVKPKVGSTTFFSYKGSDGRMDDGYTEHSGCPVLEGEKFITTVWMREGVNADKPWTLYDPSGFRIGSD